MPIYFTSLQLITTVRYLELLCKADLVVKTLKGIIKCLLEIAHTLQHDNIRRRTLEHRNVNVPLQRCRPLSLTCPRAAQLFLVFYLICKSRNICLQTMKGLNPVTEYTFHSHWYQNGWLPVECLGWRSNTLIAESPWIWSSWFKKKKRGEEKEKKPEHKTKNTPQTFLRCYWANFPPLLFCKLSLWKQTRTSSTLCQDK